MPLCAMMSAPSSCNRPIFLAPSKHLQPLADAAHASGALLVVAVTEGMSLGAVKPPREADIVAMEGQSFGLAPSYGGPFVGVLASRDKFVRQMPGRLVGQTTDQDGTPRLRADAGHPRAAHSPREGHIQYLHQSSALRTRRHRAHVPARQRRPARNGGAESFQGALRPRTNSRRFPASSAPSLRPFSTNSPWNFRAP